MNVSQWAAYWFGIRVLNSSNIIDDIEDTELLSKDDWTDKSRRSRNWKIRMQNITGKNRKAPRFQQYEQAKTNFVNAVLRRESGAKISDEEFDSAEKQYFVQIWDSREVILQKRLNREDKLLSLKKESWNEEWFDRYTKSQRAKIDKGEKGAETTPEDHAAIDDLDL